jgi:hypothetical protein
MPDGSLVTDPLPFPVLMTLKVCKQAVKAEAGADGSDSIPLEIDLILKL